MNKKKESYFVFHKRRISFKSFFEGKYFKITKNKKQKKTPLHEFYIIGDSLMVKI